MVPAEKLRIGVVCVAVKLAGPLQAYEADAGCGSTWAVKLRGAPFTAAVGTTTVTAELPLTSVILAVALHDVPRTAVTE